MPRGAEILFNPVGMAPGFSLVIGRCRFFFLRSALRDAPHAGGPRPAGHRRPAGWAARTPADRDPLRFGLTESLTGERLSGLDAACPGVRLGLRAKFPEIQVKLYAWRTRRGPVRDGWNRRPAGAGATGGHRLFRVREPMGAGVGGLLRARGATLAVAESCTGGLIAHWLTEVAGSSDYFLLSAVTYATPPDNVLGSPQRRSSAGGPCTRRRRGRLLPRAARGRGRAWVATSGIAGPSGGSPTSRSARSASGSPRGTSCSLARASPDTYTGRSMYKQGFAMKALDLLRRELLGLPHAP